MSGSLNKVQLIGHLGADPEIKTFTGGGRIANLRVATTDSWTDKQSGERRERTEWHSVVIRNDGLVGLAERYLRKGGKVYLEGSLQTRKWQDQQGQDRYSTEVVLAVNAQMLFLDRKPDAGGGAAGTGQGSGQRSGATTGTGHTFDDNLDDDEIPF